MQYTHVTARISAHINYERMNFHRSKRMVCPRKIQVIHNTAKTSELNVPHAVTRVTVCNIRCDYHAAFKLKLKMSGVLTQYPHLHCRTGFSAHKVNYIRVLK
jgi:hypothetical protein